MLPVLIVLGIIVADLAFFRLATPAPALDPELLYGDYIEGAQSSAFIAGAGPVSEIEHGDIYDDFGGYVLVEKSSLVGTEGSFEGEATYSSEDLLTYTVKSGDTLSNIAEEFGISVADILEANDKGSSLIREGEELAILPVSKDGSSRKAATVAKAEKEKADNYFTRPVSGGWNWGEVHDSGYMPAIDISKACGSTIFAAAEGTVIEVGNPAYYNSGYGGYILITHPNGTRTLYAHNATNSVEIGEEVQQGEPIGTVGNTGLTHGSTGCHVHFGVSGTVNPFAL